MDRLGRSVRGLAHILEELDQAGVLFRSATEPFDTGRMMVQMLGVFAEFERATIIDRVVAGMERKAAKGGWCGGRRPYGYDLDRTTGFLAVNEEEAPVVRVIFELYANKRLGAKAIGNWLNKRGHRTKEGKPWNHMAVLTALLNRAYVGEVYFRGKYHPAPHPPLVDRETFEGARRLLLERGEDHSKRNSNSSDYLLAGLVVCARCGKHFVGTAATGRRYRYNYYTCFSRQRYGVAACRADRLPSQELEAAVLDALLKTYENTDLIEQAIAASVERAQESLPQREDELRAVRAEIRRAEDAIDRHLSAFEAKSMPESLCGERVRALGEKLAELQKRRDELAHALEESGSWAAPDENVLQEIRGAIRETLVTGTPARRKALLQALVHEIRVRGRDAIFPVFRLLDHVPGGPAGEAVRAVSGSVPPTGFEPVLPP